MPTPAHALTNDYRYCKLIKLNPHDPTSPFVVMQEGYGPTDTTSRARLFYLQRDGFWIDEIAHSTRPDSEAGDIVFESASEALRTLSGLLGKPLVREVPVTEAEMEAYRARAMGGSAEELLRRFLTRHRATKRKQ